VPHAPRINYVRFANGKIRGDAPDTVIGVRVGGHAGLACCPDGGGRRLRGELGDLGRQRLYLRRQRHDTLGKLAVDLTRLRGDRHTALSDGSCERCWEGIPFHD